MFGEGVPSEERIQMNYCGKAHHLFLERGRG
ncbi:ABC transporter [Brucella ceti B1/94]|nr:ABC transporter [Brucella ceti B1/94]